MQNQTKLNLWVFICVIILFLPSCTILKTSGESINAITNYFFGEEDNLDPPAKLTEYKAAIQIDEIWKEKIGTGTNGKLLNLVLCISYGKIIVADGEGLLQARNLKTGNLIWETQTNYSFSAGPSSGNDIAILGTSNAEIIAFDIKTGKELWITTVSSEVLASPVIKNNKVIVRTTDGKLIAINTKNGSQLWIFERNVPTLSIRGTGTPIIVADNIIAGYADGKLLALRLSDGREIWETSIAIPSGRSEVERLVDLDADPVANAGAVFISSYQEGTVSVLEFDGEILWRNEEISSFVGLNYDWKYIYISDSNSNVWQLDQRNGASLWKQNKLHNRNLTTPVVYADYVVAGDYDGYVHWLSVGNGKQLGRMRISKSAIDAAPVVVDNILYIISQDGTLAALTAKLL